MTPNDILSLVANLAWMGLSVYGAINPNAKWAGPAATALATVTRTPQHALGNQNKPMNRDIIKTLVIGFCALTTYISWI